MGHNNTSYSADYLRLKKSPRDYRGLENIITTDDGINIDFIYIDKNEHLGLKTQIEKLQDLLQIQISTTIISNFRAL